MRGFAKARAPHKQEGVVFNFSPSTSSGLQGSALQLVAVDVKFDEGNCSVRVFLLEDDRFLVLVIGSPFARFDAAVVGQYLRNPLEVFVRDGDLIALRFAIQG